MRAKFFHHLGRTSAAVFQIQNDVVNANLLQRIEQVNEMAPA